MRPNEKITIKQWLELKPYTTQTRTDGFYIGISNQIKAVLVQYKETLVLEKEGLESLSCMLSSYLEDIVSETNILSTFVRQHTELYGKPLPFYRCDEYFEDEINPQDILFLLWFFMNSVQEQRFVAPHSPYLSDIANAVYTILDEAWDPAPANSRLKECYTLDPDVTDFYVACEFMDAVTMRNYLFHSDIYLDTIFFQTKLMHDYPEVDEIKMSHLLKDDYSNSLHGTYSRLLAYRGNEWTAEILGKDHPLYAHYKAMSRRLRGHFFYKGEDEQHIFIQHIASGVNYNLIKRSFKKQKKDLPIDSLIYMGIVNWQDEWWFSGVAVETEYNEEIVNKEKYSETARNEKIVSDEDLALAEVLLVNQQEIFRNFTKGKQIVFLPYDALKSFIAAFYEYYHESLKVSVKKLFKINKTVNPDSYFDWNSIAGDTSEENGLVFFNPKSGIEVGFNINSAFPDPDNPYFIEEKSAEDFECLLFSDSNSKELVEYCVEHYKDKLPYLSEPQGKTLLADLDFVLRFKKRDNYYSTPELSFIKND